jgi:hypothetical protein
MAATSGTVSPAWPLSFGSLLATAAMAGAAIVTWRLLLAPRPGLRGIESPEAAGW